MSHFRLTPEVDRSYHGMAAIFVLFKMAAGVTSFDLSSFGACDKDLSGFQLASSSTHAARSTLVSAEVQFSRCFNKLKVLRASDSPGFKTELNLLFDQLISENYSSCSFTNENIRQVLQYFTHVLYTLFN